MDKKMNDRSDEYIKRSLKKWAGAYAPYPRNRGFVIDQAYAESGSMGAKSLQIGWGLKKLLSLNWFFYSGNEWKIDHHETFRLASFYFASNGHLVL